MTDAAISFGADANAYAAARPCYPNEVFEGLDNALTGRRALGVELGAGSGQATTRFAPLFDHMIATERDPAMLAAAKFPDHCETRAAAAEELSFEAGSVDAVFSATAFHWMDQPLICQRVAEWLRPGGIFYPFAYGLWRVQGVAGEIVGQRLPDWLACRDARLDHGYRYEAIVKNSGAFVKVRPVACEGNLRLSPDQLAALWSTASFVKAYLAEHSAPEGYWHDFRTELRAAGDAFDVIVPVNGVVAVAD